MTTKSRGIQDVVDRSTSVEVFQRLSEPMPEEALSTDTGRGFPLTSIKAGFILERLNQVFGLLGYGWRYAPGPHCLETAGGKEEVQVKVAVQWRITESATEEGHCPPVVWSKRIDTESGMMVDSWQPQMALPHVWSEPVIATGGSAAKRKGGIPLTDAYRAAVTNAITKAAARMGVGQEVFKGETDGNGQGGSKSTARQSSRPARRSKATVPHGDAVIRSLEALQDMADIELSKLNIEEGQEVTTGLLENLAKAMKADGIDMQPARLIQCLLGEGPLSQIRAMATYNFLTNAGLSETEVKMLNKAAFPVGREAAKEEDTQ
jgi:hypothetical protein